MIKVILLIIGRIVKKIIETGDDIRGKYDKFSLVQFKIEGAFLHDEDMFKLTKDNYSY